MERSLLLVTAIAVLLIGRAAEVRAVVLSSGGGNTDAASLSLAAGPGNPAQPGFSSVGKSSTGNASVTYLGNGWVITAAHVTIDNNIGGNPTPIRFGGGSFQADMSSIHVLHNSDNTSSDLQLFHLTTDPGLPSAIPALIAGAPPEGRVIMIGNGLTAGAAQFWNVDKTIPNNWVWNPQAAPADPGPNDFAGFDVNFSAEHVIRWGENTVASTDQYVTVGVDNLNNPINVHGFTTSFDGSPAAYQFADAPLASEAQASNGDSGGAVFTLVNGQWQLSGIMVTVFQWNHQPDSTAVFGNLTLAADLSAYRDQILAIVPEPSSVILALVAVGALALARRRLKLSGALGSRFH